MKPIQQFVVYTFHVNKEDIRYYTDKRIPYDDWFNFITEVKECDIIDSLTVWEIFNKTISKCGIKMIHPICEEYYTF